MVNTLGPVLETSLLPGEKVAVRTRRVLSRKGRSVVRVRLFGECSLGWLDALVLWGASIEVFTCQGGNVKHLIDLLYPDVHVAPPGRAYHMPPFQDWDGVFFATLGTPSDAQQAALLIKGWRPRLAVFMSHHSVSRRTFGKWISECADNYHGVVHQQCSHQAFGGVTPSKWRLAICYRDKDPDLDFHVSRMTTGMYARNLQTVLDDTLGPPAGGVKFENKTGSRGFGMEGPCGILEGGKPVYDSNGLGPDLSQLTTKEQKELWVLAVSVFSSKRVLRQFNQLELLSMWDYAGKIWYRGMSKGILQELLQARVCSPPAKILTTVAFTICNDIRAQLLPEHEADVTHAVTGVHEASKKGAMELKGIQRSKAAVADDAGVDLSYWALPNETPAQTSAREVLRRFAHAWWVYNLEREAYCWAKKHGNHQEDLEAIADCVRRAAGSDYWEWHRGSRLFFWRFPEECDWRQEARDGVEFWHLTDPPKGLHFQNIPPSSREAEIQLRIKVFQLCFRWYLVNGPPDLVTPRFAVEKVSDDAGNLLDIRAVWDAKRNGLNATLWCPKFCLPTTQDGEDIVIKWLSIPVGLYLRRGSPPQDYSQDQDQMIKSWQFDDDVAQQFNNFRMHKKEQHSHGVRFIHTRNDGSYEPETFLQCCVLNFGCLASPYVANQGQERIMELVQGDPKDSNNPYQYAECVLNLPTSKTYDPSLPRVLLLREDGEFATVRRMFVDDLHAAARGISGANAGEAARVTAFRMNYYGNQVAARKFGPPTLIPRPWNGAMTHTDAPYPVKGTTAKKWNRGRSGLAWIWNQCNIPDGTQDPVSYVHELKHWEVFVDTAELRRIAGLWIHLTELYTEGRCFLKGFFNALEAFRSDRDLDGWRLEISMDEAAELETNDASRATAAGDYPALTRVTYQLLMHTNALMRLFNDPEPRVLLIRPTEKSMVRYACGDASAEGFAQATQYPDLVIDERDGLWIEEVSEKSSNLREALNIANHLKHDIQAGKHDGCEIWQGTDNAVWSAVCNKGMSSVRHLFELLVEIKVLCYEHEVFYHCFHISGERMIATGIDGLSRGDKDSGIALGYDLRDFLPLDVSAFDIADNRLEEWCRGWMGKDYSTPTTPIEWFLEAQKPGVHIIAPPPAAALHALKEVARGRLKRPRHLTYVIMIPRLLYQEEWRSRFQKEVDIWFTVHTGPALGYSGWKGTKWWQLAGPCRKCQKRVTFDSGIVCANFGVTRGLSYKACDGMWCAACFVPSRLDPCDISLPEDFTGATIEELGEQDRFMVARAGDHLCTSFQCPNCHSQNIRGRDLDVERNIADACFESLCIRAQLDSFWARTPDTVKNHVKEARFMARYGAALNFTPMPPLGPFRLGQDNGMLQAILLEMRAMEPGRNRPTVQFGTARMIRATTTVLWETSPLSGSDIVLSSGSIKGRYIATMCPSEGRWYSLFNTGIATRKGDIVHQDRAYTLEVVHAVIEAFESQFQQEGFNMPVRDMEAAMFFIASCTAGFRGYETVWTDLGALRYDIEYCEESEDETAVAWPVTGRFKNEHGAWNCYIIPIAGVTGSGIRVFEWTQRMIKRLALVGRVDGWLFRKENGVDRALASDYAENIYQKLENIQKSTTLIDSGCNVREEYGIQRSGRRFFDTQCINMKVSATDIEFQCRWRTDRAKGGKTVMRSMLHTYAEVRNMKPTLLRPSLAL